MSVDLLRILALVYLDVTGESAHAVGLAICDNHQFIKGLLRGGGCKASNAYQAYLWLDRHWPRDPSGRPIVPRSAVGPASPASEEVRAAA